MKRTTIPIVLATACLLILGATAPSVAAPPSGDDGPLWVEGDSSPRTRNSPLRRSSISKLVDRTSRTVVNVIVTYGGGDFAAFLREPPGGREGMGQGSGFIIHPSGYTLTNYHVVKGATRIKVRMKDQSEYFAKVIGVDPKTDLALMKIEAERSFPAMPLGNSESVEVGDYVVAIGNPLGLHHTVTSGIVSALGRRNLGLEDDSLYTDFIQIDAPINPGNSGGPLVNLAGEAIGINTAINQKGQGIGFAIPINVVKKLLPQLKSKGYVTRSWLGARVQPLSKSLAESFSMEKARGALITEVLEDSPAGTAGLKAGDVIVGFGGESVRDSQELPWLVSSASPGQQVDIRLYRDGREVTRSVTLKEHPEQEKPDIPETRTPERARSTELNVKVKNLTESLARQLGAGSRGGVVVTDIGDDSPARGAGLRKRDVITEIGPNSISSKSDFESAVEALKSGELVRLKLVRGGRVVYIAFER
jgi:serine protease Do